MKKKSLFILIALMFTLAVTITVWAFIGPQSSDPDRIDTPDPDKYAISVERQHDQVGKSLVPINSAAKRTNEIEEFIYTITVYSNVKFIFQLDHNLPEQFNIGVESGQNTGTFVPIEGSFQTNSGYNNLIYDNVEYQYAIIFRVRVTLLELHDNAFHDLIFTVNPTGTIEE